MISIRLAVAGDAPVVAAMISAMLDDMAQLGGHAVAPESGRRALLRGLVEEHLAAPEYRYVVATSDDAPIGTANAQIVALPAVFAPQRVLHISSAYVVPAHRRQGIGRRLVESLLTWGREQECDHADLNVLMGNPARALYADLGFTDMQSKMTLRF